MPLPDTTLVSVPTRPNVAIKHNQVRMNQQTQLFSTYMKHIVSIIKFVVQLLEYLFLNGVHRGIGFARHSYRFLYILECGLCFD